MKKTRKPKARKAVISSTLPVVIPGSRPAPPDGFPVTEYSYSMFALFCTNPVLARVKYINRDSIDTTRSSTRVLGEAVHAGLKAFLGGDDRFPYMATDTDSDRLKCAFDATDEYLKQYPDGFIDWKKNIPDRATLNELALKTITGYVKEWDRGHIKDTIMVEQKMREAIRVRHENREISLPIPLVGFSDHVYRSTAGEICIDDHKTVFRYTDPDAVDGGKLIQAAMYYLLVAAITGEAPKKFTFREYKVSQNTDKSAQTREYVIVYDEMPIVFDLFLRLYEDITKMLLGQAVYLPNILAMFDRDVGLLAYAHRLDDPENVEKEKKRARVEDIAVILQKKLVRNKNLKRFMEAKANLFTSNISIDYKTMKHAHEKIRYKLLEHGISLTFADKIEGLSVDLYRFEPTVGVKMSTVEKYKKDIEQILGVSGVRVLAPIPDTEYVGFEVPKKKRQFAELPKGKPTGLELDLGVDVYGKSRTLDLTTAPHVLVAGTTGSGKSVSLHAILEQLTRLPKHEVRFALLDPKLVELSDYEEDAHTDAYRDKPEEILGVLMNYVEEMNKRYAIFKKNKVRTLAQYREKVGTDIPYVVIVIDEFGDLIMGGGAMSTEIKHCMIVLAQKARAAGIHLIIATQRPSAKVVDGLIKANFPVRICFQVVSRTESEIVLDRAGGELLLGKGDMLFSRGGVVDRLQGYNV